MSENQVVTDVESFDGDVPAILPDGWQEGDALFQEEQGGELESLLADGQGDDGDALLALLSGDGQANAAPTTDAGSQTPTQDAGTPDASAQTDGSAPVASAPRKLTLKVNHREQEVDVSSMSDDDLRALLQKGYAFDAMKEAEDRREYLRVYQEQLDAGMTETVARLVAKDAAGGKTYVVKDGQIAQPEQGEFPAPASASGPAQPVNMRTTPPPGAAKRDLRAEVEQFRALFPDVKEVPDDVAKAVAKGIPVVTAYLAYQNRESSRKADSLSKENKTLRQNAANVQRAPVRGVTGGGVGTQKSDPFAEGFDAGWNWT